MADAEDKQVEEALARLAREVNAAAPRAHADLTARVMDDAADVTAEASDAALESLADTLVDPALEALAHEVNARAPKPGTDLMARVLADAASVAPPMEAASVSTRAARPRTLGDILFGWTGGAVAAMSLCLSMGVAIGMEIDPGQMPILGAAEEGMNETEQVLFLPEEMF